MPAIAIVIGLIIATLIYAFYLDYTEEYEEDRREYRRQKRMIRTERNKKKYKEKLEKYKLKSEEHEPKKSKRSVKRQVQDIRNDDFYAFMEIVHKQMERFALYGCKNDENLQKLFEKTFLSISRLETKLDVNNYGDPAIIQFYKVELEQFFVLLGEGPTFTVDRKQYKKLTDCLCSICDKADRLGKNIKEWQSVMIDVKFDTLIEYIDN